MPTLYSKPFAPILLLAEDASLYSPSAAELLHDQDCKLVVARSVREALEMLTDLHFIEGNLDAVLTDYAFKDGFGTRILKQSKRQFPDVSAAIIAPRNDALLKLWTNVRGVDVLKRDQQALTNWLQQIQISVQG
jgi:hypothetical protein